MATMPSERSADPMNPAPPRAAERIDMRHRWIVRVLANPRIDRDAAVEPFAREVLARAAEAGRVEFILDRSKPSDRHRVLMPTPRFGERAAVSSIRRFARDVGRSLGALCGSGVQAWVEKLMYPLRCLGGNNHTGKGWPKLAAHRWTGGANTLWAEPPMV